ncbi:MAG TPA: ATP-binding protein [Hanamia sp.]
MYKDLQAILSIIQQSEHLSNEEKTALLKAAKAADKELEITSFKLKETIEELEHKRKAVETQNRELEIEVSLERVRIKAMAMQESDELTGLIAKVYEELKKLDFVLTRAMIWIFNPDDLSYQNWMANRETEASPGSYLVKYNESPSYLARLKGWKERIAKWEYALSGEDKRAWDQFLFNETGLSGLPDVVKEGMKESERIILNASFSNFGGLAVSGLEPLSDQQMDILYRFGKVFDLTYTRFLDLQKAEAQAREAQIELGLERVRARAMAMHNSEELKEVVRTLFEELTHLDVNLQACLIATFDAVTFDQRSWMIHLKTNEPYVLLIPHNEQPFYLEMLKAWKERNHSWTYILEDKAKIKWEGFLFSDTDFRLLPQEVKEGMQKPRKVFFAASYYNYGAIQVSSPEPFSNQSIDILQRFSKVFDSSYTRFLDLQKAEAQAREAQIELGLERVRARAMAMQKSEELNALIGIVFTELTKLELVLTRCVIIIYDAETKGAQWWMANSEAPSAPMNFFVKYANLPFFNMHLKGWEERDFKWQYILEGENKIVTDNFLFNETELKTLPDFVIEGMKAPLKVYLNASFNNFGNLTLATLEPLSEKHFDILLRFAKVFDLTYTRFNDLQKAEAQAREAKIEASLERIRSRTMGMQKSNQLVEVVALLSKELVSLGIKQFATCGYVEIEEENKRQLSYLTNSDAGSLESFYLPLTGEPIFDERYNAWKRQEPVLRQIVYAEDLKRHLDFAYSGFGSKEAEDVGRNLFPNPTIFYSSNFSYGYLSLVTGTMLTEEDELLMARFTRMFEQTYTRFLDLQKAEAQAREAQIQLALERVRARTMAMQKSDELSETASVLFQQMNALGNTPERLNIGVINEENGFTETWATEQDGHKINHSFNARLDEPTTIAKLYKGWKAKKSSMTVDLSGNELKQWIDYLQNELKMPVNEELLQNRRVQSVAYFKEGFILMTTPEPLPAETISLLERFAEVFNLTYTRFLDLQKAEAQAREAKIETSLERVRSRTMAMHKSTDLLDVISVLSEQFLLLGFKIHSANFNTSYRQKDWNLWLYNPGTTMYPDQIHIPYLDNPFFNRTLESLANGADFTAFVFTKEEKDGFLDHLYSTTIAKNASEERKRFSYSAPGFAWSTVYLKNTALTIANYDAEPYTEEQNAILRRFGNVFEQTYTRFLDLQKAEAQAREATIEASLERVRGKAMSMHSSRDLADTIEVFYHEVELLSITPRRCGVGLMDKETHAVELSTMNTTEQGESIEIIGKLKLAGHPVLEGIYDNWILQKEYHPVLRGNEIKEYYKLIRPQIAYPDYPTDTVQYGYFFFFNEGGVYAWTEKELGEDELKIYRRFTSVLSLTYKRYKDLKDAEANTREAIKQASLDRVRAETASMRTTGDLEKITPLIWNELTTLRVPFIRCGVFIMDEKQKQIHSFLSTPDGKAIAAFQLPYHSAGELSKVLAHWHKNEIFKDHWDEAAFAEWTKSLVNQGAIASEEQYSTAHRPVNLDLNFLPFLQGMLYVGSEAPLSEEEILLVQSLTDAFSTAYARYEDFNKLEAAKKQVDSTLNELQATQKQLVQSEKMASLGELTAGIAHEIQNPLNFVNNFSEVNTELLEELKVERLKPNAERDDTLQDELINDVIDNSEKINHHGKRAGDIVKGMLQHSRSSTGVKEPTDINKLADEYLRLSYHGLRAKDKEFNATMKTDFDESIGKINIIPQDIGRVLLNLYNNAFYACTERSRNTVNQQKSGNPISYNPTVSVSTKKPDNHVIITVSDNGNGIPQNIVDKIFQPFFTTKPTGSGTGLGLSLSYDIIKAHEGEIKVETKEGEGSEFIIQLPSNAAL